MFRIVMSRVVLACLIASIAGPALALENCNPIKKLEDRLQCLQRNIDTLSHDSVPSRQPIYGGEPVLLHSKSRINGCITTSQNTLFLNRCDGVGPDAQWFVEPASK